jgi:hypothetical protein
MKRKIRQQIIIDLKSIDLRLKFSNGGWNDAVKTAFNSSGSFDFDNLAYVAPNTAQELISKFKLIK